MNIAIYVAELDIRGGTHKQVLRLSQYLQAAGHMVHVFTPIYAAQKTYEDFSQIRITSLGTSTPTSKWKARLMSWLAPWRLAWGMERVDILNVHDNRGILFFVAAWMMRRSRISVWQINDLHPAFGAGAHAGGLAHTIRLKERIHKAANRWMAKRVSAITVNVGKNVQRVKDHLSATSTLIHCGVDIPIALQRPRRPVEGESLKVVSAGAFFPYRNYENLVLACAEVQLQLERPIYLSIIGDTRYDITYANRVKTLANARRLPLQVLENLSQAEMDQEISSGHVYAFLNVDQSWGLTVFEAAARAKPIVLSESVGACELLAGRPGFLIVNPLSVEAICDALLQVLSDPEACVVTATNAQSQVAGMSWNSMYCAPLEQIFFKLLGQQTQRGSASVDTPKSNG